MQSVKQYIKDCFKNNEYLSNFVETIRYTKCDLVREVWAIKYGKREQGKKPLVKLAFREYLYSGKRQVSELLHLSMCGGYRMTFYPQRTYYYGEYTQEDIDKNRMCTLAKKDKSQYNISREFLWKQSDIKELKYFANYKLNEYFVFEFLRKLKSFPQMELLFKNPLTKHLWSDTRVLKLSKEKMRKVLEFIKNTNERYLSYNEIHWRITHNNATHEQYEKQKEFSHFKKQFSYTKNYTNEELKNIFKLVCRGNYYDYRLRTYNDYLHLCEYFHRDIKDVGVYLSKSWEEQHDNLSRDKEEIEERERAKAEKERKRLERKMLLLTNKNRNAILELITKLSDNEMTIDLPKSKADLRTYSAKLDNCVGHMNYGTNMQMGKCIILGIKVNGNLTECVELQPTEKTYRIAQLYGKHNSIDEYHDRAETLVKKLISKIQPLQPQLISQQIA